MLTKSDRKTMAAMEAEFARDGHARSFIPAALADLDAKDALLAKALKDTGRAGDATCDRAGNILYRRCPICGGLEGQEHYETCVFAEIARHLEGVRGGTGDG